MKYKLKAGALQFAIFISVLIALLLAGLVLFAYSSVLLKEQSKAAIENIRLADAGIFYLTGRDVPASPDPISLEDFHNDNQKVVVCLSQWGIFQKAYAKSVHRKKVFEKFAFLGSKSGYDTPALFLRQGYSPLTLVGDTYLQGICCLPAEGIKSGYIGNEAFHGDALVHGRVKRSSAKLPEIEEEIRDGLKVFLGGKDQNVVAALPPKGKAKISFSDVTRRFYSSKAIVLADTELTGNMIIISDTLIRVKHTARLTDVILVSPIVEIEHQTQGTFQVIASKSIAIGKNCRLNYPSAFVLLQHDDGAPEASQLQRNPESHIFIDSGTAIKGFVCYLADNTQGYDSQIILEKQSFIKGEVYCEGNFELKGKVAGAVFTNQFIVRAAGSRFINHIFNGVIENEDMPEKYGGILFRDEDKTVMKWLY